VVKHRSGVVVLGSVWSNHGEVGAFVELQLGRVVNSLFLTPAIEYVVNKSAFLG